MRAFVVACLAVVLIAACGVLALGAMQEPTGSAFSTQGARIDPSWNWREMFGRTGNAAADHQACKQTHPYQWIFMDFGENNASCTNQ